MISVILPGYNHGSFLKERIDSILNQTYQDFELIILDDKSTDDSRDIIEQYRNDQHISHIIYNEQNSGLTYKQWNKGISLAKGDYIWLAESDDVADPLLLQTLYDNITKNKDIVISYCQSYKINKDSEIVGDWSEQSQRDVPELFATDFVIDGIEFIEKCFLIRNFIPNASAVLFRKETFLQIGGAATDAGYMADWLTWLKMLTKGKMAFTQLRLNHFRSHRASNVPKKWTNAKDYRLKRSHIRMRKAFMTYAKEQHLSKYIYNQNKKYLIKNHLEEAIFLFTHQQILLGIKHCGLAAKYIFK